MFRLAHISDLHLGPLPKVHWSQLLNKRITGYLNWKFNRNGKQSGSSLSELLAHMNKQPVDHIAITGDLVNLALPGEISNAQKFLENLAPPEKCSIVGGNHDAYVPKAFSACMNQWSDYMGGVSSAKQFPYLRSVEDIAIIGCNTANATLPFFATGTFSQIQADRLGQLLEQSKGLCRVILIHHPPVHNATRFMKRMIGIDRFQTVVKQYGAELILHGHTHLDTRYEIEGANGNVPVICVPAMGAGFGGHKPAGQYNLFEIKQRKSGWDITLKAYGKASENAPVTVLEEIKLS